MNINDLQLEQAVLGAMVLERSAFAKVGGHLSPEMFAGDARHPVIFEAIRSLDASGVKIDLLTVSRKARDLCGDSSVIPYIAEITAMVSSAENIESHALFIIENYIRRRYLSISGQMVQKISSGDDVFEAEKWLKGQQDELARLTEILSVERAADRLPEVYRDIGKRGTKEDVRTPTFFPSLDRAFNGYVPGELTIIAGRPAMGKSAFMTSLVRRLVENGKTVYVFSLEMTSKQLIERILSDVSGVEARKIKRGVDEREMEKIREAGTPFFSGANLFITQSAELTVSDIKAKIRAFMLKSKLDVVFIDYIQIIKVEDHVKEKIPVSHVARQLAAVAKELEIPVVALSQLNRSGAIGAESARPTLSSLSGSDVIAMVAHNVFILHRPEYYKQTTLRDGSPSYGKCEVLPEKLRESGSDTVVLNFDADHSRFGDPEEVTYFDHEFHFSHP